LLEKNKKIIVYHLIIFIIVQTSVEAVDLLIIENRITNPVYQLFHITNVEQLKGLEVAREKHMRTLCARDGFENRIGNPVYQLFHITNVEQLRMVESAGKHKRTLCAK